MKTVKKCDCARCLGLPTADKKYGFDYAEIPQKHCLSCHELIGSESYKLALQVARFGQAFVFHKRCLT